MASLRETIATALMNDVELKTLGLPDGNVFDADTAESPSVKPFLVLRFMEGQPGMAHVKKRPFDVWGYDDKGDRTRAERLVNRAGDVLEALLQVQTDTGWILQIEKGEQGTDLEDDGFEALVVPRHMTAIASGI